MKKPWFYNTVYLREHANLIKGDVIDVGAGNLKYKPLITGVEGVRSYTALDYYASEGVEIVADLNKPLDIPDCSYDTAINISVIEHLKEPQIALNEMYRILRSGGTLLLSTPWVYPYHHEPDDFFRFSRYALEYMLEKAGFTVALIEPSGSKWRICLVLLSRWFPWSRRLVNILEQYVAIPEKSKYTEDQYLSTPAHHVIAHKK